MILVDTSIWIDHFRAGDRRLTNLLDRGEVAMHPFVLGELLLGNVKIVKMADDLNALPKAAVASDVEVVGTCASSVDYAREGAMSKAVEKAVEALELLPEDLQDQAADFLLSQARKFRVLKDAIDEGIADIRKGRVVPWDLEEFLKETRKQGKR
jgi:predicted nucleic acid-binding protein